MSDDSENPCHGWTRRRVLQAVAAGAAGIAGVAGLSRPTMGNDILMRPIPASGERIPIVGLGTYRTFDIDATSAEWPLIREVLQRFAALGGTVIDSSPMYGRAEATVGELTAELGIGEQLFHATKVWTRGRETGIREMERSMDRMGAAPLDLMQVHNLVDTETHLETLKGWRREGRIRYLGVTHYTVASHRRLARWMEREPLDFIQLNYNIAVRDAADYLLPAAAGAGVATLINRPFQQGRLFRAVRGHELPQFAVEMGCATWAQFYLKYILGQPGVTCVIPATSQPEHLADNMGAGRGHIPDGGERRRMVRYFENLPG